MSHGRTLRAVARDEGRHARHAARRVLWAESSLSRVRGCGAIGLGPGGSVVVKATGVGADRRAGFGGLAVCGSTWVCPVCSWKIANHRQTELKGAIEAWEALGGQVMLLTLTMRHRRGQRLSTLWDGLSHAWGKVTSGKSWKRDQALYNVAGWTRVVEATHGANGWHLHVHALIFVDTSGVIPGQSVLDLGPAAFQRWKAGLVSQGLEAPLAAHGGLDVRMGTAASAAALGSYLTKGTYSAASASWEVVGGQGKTASRGNRAPFRILADIVDQGDADDLDLWHEWERGSKGRRQQTWSRGFRSLVALPAVALGDEEVVELDELHGEHLAVISLQDWRSTWRWRSSEVLAAAEADDSGDAVRVLLGCRPPP